MGGLIDVIRRIWQRNAFISVVMRKGGVPHFDDVLGLISKEHVAVRSRPAFRFIQSNGSQKHHAFTPD
jgi:hypothetical protein